MQEIFNATQTVKEVPMTQSASSMSGASKQQFCTFVPPVDKLLSGGITKGQIIEFSGPPGSPKEFLAIKMVSSFIEAGDEVVFVGMYFNNNNSTYSLKLAFVDTQNMTSPATLCKALDG